MEPRPVKGNGCGKAPASEEEVLVAIHDRRAPDADLRTWEEATWHHEVRTPLTSILALAQAIAAAAPTGTVSGMASDLQVAVRHLAGLLEGASPYQHHAAPEPCRIHDVIREALVVAGAHRRPTLRFDVRLDPTARRAVRIDRTRMRQVIVNLVTNACKHTGEGRIRITGRIEPGTPDLLHMAVIDPGSGMTPAQVRHIFDPYMSDGTPLDGAEGVGLGMPIVRKIIDAAGGDIEVRSEPGRGTVIAFHIPVGSRPRPARETPSRRRRPLRILLVEDDRLHRLLSRSMLEATGHVVHPAATASDALRLLALQTCDVALLDWHLPDSTGFALAQAIRAAYPGLRIVCLSGHDLGKEPPAVRAAFDDHLLKPAHPQRLERLLERLGAQHPDMP